jgi:Protein-glutamine gamma-glutamyltransferase
MNMREFWANEAAMMRDKSGVLGKEVLMPVSYSRNDYAPNEDSGKVTVRGMTTSQLKEWVAALSSDKRKEIFKSMNIHRTLSFKFSSVEELQLHLIIREATIKRMIQLEQTSNTGTNPIATYPGGDDMYLTEEYWNFLLPKEFGGVLGGFIPQENVDIFDALNSLMQDGKNKDYKGNVIPPSHLELDCNRMSVVITYTALLDAMKELVGLKKLSEENKLSELQNIFKRLFPNDDKNKTVIGTWHEFYKGYGAISLLKNEYFKRDSLYKGKFQVSDAELCLPGDIVYFENDPLYGFLCREFKRYFDDNRNDVEERRAVWADPRRSTEWTGEYCICTSPNKFAGFGLRSSKGSTIIELSSEQVRTCLFEATKDLFNLALEKAKPLSNLIKKSTIVPSRDKVILNEGCYRVNTEKILAKM